jgi:hypothetical protein
MPRYYFIAVLFVAAGCGSERQYFRGVGRTKSR